MLDLTVLTSRKHTQLNSNVRIITIVEIIPELNDAQEMMPNTQNF